MLSPETEVKFAAVLTLRTEHFLFGEATKKFGAEHLRLCTRARLRARSAPLGLGASKYAFYSADLNRAIQTIGIHYTDADIGIQTAIQTAVIPIHTYRLCSSKVYKSRTTNTAQSACLYGKSRRSA